MNYVQHYADAIQAKTIRPDEIPMQWRDPVQMELLQRWIAKRQTSRLKAAS